MEEKIIDAYIEYRKTLLDKFENPKHLRVVILMLPEAFCKLRAEGTTIYNDNFIYFIYLAGRKTPIIIRNDLPENTIFIIQSQSDYERKEKEELLLRFYKMFGD
jgi:hypothetical protein